MAFLFGRNRQRSNADICRSTKELLTRLTADEKPNPRVEEELARNLAQMKLTLQGTAEIEVSPQQAHQLIEFLTTDDVLLPLAQSISRLPFEARKDAQIIFSHILRFKPETPQHPNLPQSSEPYVLQYFVHDRPDIINALCHGYDHRESAMPCGGILREALKNDSIAALILYDEPQPDGRSSGIKDVNPEVPASGKGVFWRFFEWIDKSAFEVSADAFSTFREILTRHKKLVSHYLLVNYQNFTSMYNSVLLESPSYVTKRQSIKLLGELLLERANYTLMTQYIASSAHLKIAMRLLKDDRRMINYEGFHVFKIFVANPNKTPEVERLLANNKDRLLKFLPPFLEDREEDVQFKDEKAYLIRMIEQLPSPAQIQFQQVNEQQSNSTQGVIGRGSGSGAVTA